MSARATTGFRLIQKNLLLLIRPSSSSAAPKRQKKEASESVLDALNAGRDPRAMSDGKEVVLRHAESAELDGVACGDDNARCYVLTSFEQLGLFLPTSVKSRDSKNSPGIPCGIVTFVPVTRC